MFLVLAVLAKELKVGTHKCAKTHECAKQHNNFIWREAIVQIIEGYTIKFDSGPQE